MFNTLYSAAGWFWRACGRFVSTLSLFEASCLKLYAAAAGVLLGLSAARRFRRGCAVLAALVLLVAAPVVILKFIICLLETRRGEVSG